MNFARDYANNVDLKLAGWNVIRIWECEIRTKAKQEETLRNLYNRIIGTHNDETYHFDGSGIDSIAAEPDTSYGDK